MQRCLPHWSGLDLSSTLLNAAACFSDRLRFIYASLPLNRQPAGHPPTANFGEPGRSRSMELRAAHAGSCSWPVLAGRLAGFEKAVYGLSGVHIFHHNILELQCLAICII